MCFDELDILTRRHWPICPILVTSNSSPEGRSNPFEGARNDRGNQRSTNRVESTDYPCLRLRRERKLLASPKIDTRNRIKDGEDTRNANTIHCRTMLVDNRISRRVLSINHVGYPRWTFPIQPLLLPTSSVRPSCSSLFPRRTFSFSSYRCSTI